MDIELPEQPYRGSGYMLHEDNRLSGQERSSNFSRENYSCTLYTNLVHPDIEEKDLNRKSNYKTTHECNCTN